jgi:gluconate 5-dehydrogenase
MSRVLVTGAGGRLGGALCTAFADAGWDVLAGVRRAGAAPEGTEPVALDNSDDAAIGSAADTLVRAGDGGAPTEPVAVVGNASNRAALRGDGLDRAAFHDLLDVDLVGHALLAKAVAERARAAGAGAAILFVSSIYGSGGVHEDIYPDGMAPSPVHYSATKAALHGLTRDLAARWGRDGIRVNCLAPGGIAAGQDAGFVAAYERETPLGRMGDAAEIAALAVTLCSPAASYVTGQVIAADGGWSAW